jgi:hypothetical protein
MFIAIAFVGTCLRSTVGCHSVSGLNDAAEGLPQAANFSHNQSMAIVTRLCISGYRSLRDVRLELGAFTVVTGANGSLWRWKAVFLRRCGRDRRLSLAA